MEEGRGLTAVVLEVVAKFRARPMGRMIGVRMESMVQRDLAEGEERGGGLEEVKKK